MALNHDVLSPSKPVIGFVLRSLSLPSLRHTVLSLRDYGGQDVGRTVARLVGALQRQAVIEEFTKDRVLTSIYPMMGFHFALG